MRGLWSRADDAPALVDAASGAVLTYAGLDAEVARLASAYEHLAGAVVLLGMHRTTSSVVRYLALTHLGATVVLVDPRTPRSLLDGWIDGYRPDARWGLAALPDQDGRGRASTSPEAEDRVLLPTSGSTGSPKFVRLSQRAVLANARQIVTALRLTERDRAVTHLPLFYSYGLSVLHSHLAAGAAVVLSATSSMRPEFVATLQRERITTLAGVPFSFEVFSRIRLFQRDLPDLRQVTVAGGRLATPRILEFGAELASRGAGLWTMYGQTEATARIAVLPPEHLPEVAGSVGWPVPGTTVSVDDPDAGGVGEFVVSGPQVMLGYALSRDDIGIGDTTGGVLRTGDLGRIDDAGRLWVHGRLRRIAKVFGSRVALDDVEAILDAYGVAAALAGSDTVIAVIEAEPTSTVDPELHRRLERAAGLPPDAVQVVTVPRVPRSAAGKVDHRTLEAMLEH